MRYLLSWHIRESELHERTPEWREEVLSFLTVLENELLMSSELELVEVLSAESQAIVVGPGRETREGIYNAEGKPSARIWIIRVESRERAEAIAARLAGQLDTWIEVRECFSGAQRP